MCVCVADPRPRSLLICVAAAIGASPDPIVGDMLAHFPDFNSAVCDAADCAGKQVSLSVFLLSLSPSLSLYIYISPTSVLGKRYGQSAPGTVFRSRMASHCTYSSQYVLTLPVPPSVPPPLSVSLHMQCITVCVRAVTQSGRPS